MRVQRAFCRPGSDLLSRVLRRSTISAGAFHGRVRNGIGCSRSAITTRSAKRTLYREAVFFVPRRRLCFAYGRKPASATARRRFSGALAEHRPCKGRSCVSAGQIIVFTMSIRNENDQADRTISTGKLQALPLFHTRPINVVVFHGSQGILVLRWVSRLDAFSGYPVRI